jgi:putative membrane protein
MSKLLVLPSLFILALAACNHDTPAASPDNAPQPVSAVSTGSGPGDAVGVSSSPLTPDAGAAMSTGGPPTPLVDAHAAPAAAPAPVALTDEQILLITHTANQGEIEQAKLAQSKAKDARVKKLAAMMIKDHKEADAKGVALAKKDKLSPAPSPDCTALESDASTATSTLKGKTGADFDAGYVDTQVKEHQAVLDTIDQKLIPAAKNADVSAYLAEVRPKVAMHLQHAQDLQKSMQK